MKNCFKVLFFIILIFVLLSCEKIDRIISPEDYEPVKRFLFLYTNDEHGHMWEKADTYKAVSLYEMWDAEIKACPDCIVYRLSGGDNYTGSAISSIFKGESMADVMKFLHYDVSAVGNHEFDFGSAAFFSNRMKSDVKYVSTNLLSVNLKPVFPGSVTIERDSVKMGFIGVTTEELKQISYSEFFRKVNVVQSINSVEREIRHIQDNVDAYVILAHQSFENSKRWFMSLDERHSKKPLIVFNAHTHKSYIKDFDGTTFIQAGKYLNSYAKVIIKKEKGEYKIEKAEIVPIKKSVRLALPEAQFIKKFIDKYIIMTSKLAGRKIGNAEKDLTINDFGKILTCSWLERYPEADLALSNPGAYRDKITKGSVRKSDIISMLPFENRIVISEIDGKTLMFDLNLSENSYIGAYKKGNKWFLKNGSEILPDKKYKAVINEFMYNNGDGYRFVGKGIVNKMTLTSWRDPLYSLLSEKTNKGENIEEVLKECLKKY